ncbi:hypothetical protein BDV29DRAFT_185081 [Aspergillus leporis]|uniref:Uncharacterized protein n=1 Tax=Aspergillus leporis TaxID=41062 RepID=A0A5N5WIL0_9EURO|nr:hypothetical protein BDV29DRAFT_185081 [Aspergillus leporis]
MQPDAICGQHAHLYIKYRSRISAGHLFSDLNDTILQLQPPCSTASNGRSALNDMMKKKPASPFLPFQIPIIRSRGICCATSPAV